MTTNLTETAQWEEGIRQFETSDPVEGGPDGVDNIPTRQLANRTAYLKNALEDMQASLTGATRQATEAVQGTAKVATQAVVDTGTDDATIVTPKKLAARFTTLVKQATESVLGLAKVATQDQVAAGTDDATIVTPKKLAAVIANTVAKQATETDIGAAKIATQDLTTAGTDDTTVVTPKKLRAGFSASLGTNGYLAFPTWLGGLVLQWGSATAAASGNPNLSVTFPTAFPNACFCALSTVTGSALGNFTTLIYSVSKTTLSLSVQANAAISAQGVRWIALGN